MDSLTQIVLGIAVAEITAGKELKNKTFLYGAILGSLPDFDIITGMFMNAVDANALHRGISHSILFFIILSPVIGKCISQIENSAISFTKSSKMVFWILFTHSLLDLFTSWGTRLFWPLDWSISFKTIFVIDPVFTIPLLIGIILAYKKHDFIIRKKLIFKGLFFSLFYLLLGVFIKTFALLKFENELQKQHISYEKIIVKPTAFNCVLWNANIKNNNEYYLADYSLFDKFPIKFKKYVSDSISEKMIEKDTQFLKLKNISEDWYIISHSQDTIFFNDLRFGLIDDNPEKTQFAFSYTFVKKGNQFEVFEVKKKRQDGKRLLRNLWKRMWGNPKITNRPFE